MGGINGQVINLVDPICGWAYNPQSIIKCK